MKNPQKSASKFFSFQKAVKKYRNLSLCRKKLRLELLEDRFVLTTLIPNDPAFDGQWALHNEGQEFIEWDATNELWIDIPGTAGGPTAAGADIDMPEAWYKYGTGDASVVISVIDSGIDYTHEDLYKNIWLNQGEIPHVLRSQLVDTDNDGLITFWDLNEPENDALVSDSNGNAYIDAGDLLADANWANGVNEDNNWNIAGTVEYVDDLVGWDFNPFGAPNNTTEDNDPLPEQAASQTEHGTFVAGVLAAEGNNNVGIAGVNWKAQLMVIKIDATKLNDPEHLAEVFEYSANHKRAGTNVALTVNTWLAEKDPITTEAFQTHEDLEILMVSGAHNSGRNVDGPLPIEQALNHAAIIDLDHVIAVANTDRFDQKAVGSNFGPISVDLAAPSVEVLGAIATSNVDPGYGDHPYVSNQGAVVFPGDAPFRPGGTSFATPYVAGVAALAWSTFPHATMQEVRTAIFEGVDTFADGRFDHLWSTECTWHARLPECQLATTSNGGRY